ncbi:EME1 endonuclease, partial [Polypterus senegalus]
MTCTAHLGVSTTSCPRRAPAAPRGAQLLVYVQRAKPRAGNRSEAATGSCMIFFIIIMVLLIIMYQKDPLCCKARHTGGRMASQQYPEAPPSYFSSSQNLMSSRVDLQSPPMAFDNPEVQGGQLFLIGPPESYHLPPLEPPLPRLPSYESVRKKDRQRHIHKMIADRFGLVPPSSADAGETQYASEANVVVLVPTEDFISMILCSSEERQGISTSGRQSLKSWARKILEHFGKKTLTVAVVNLETYFRRQRDQASFNFYLDGEWAGGCKVDRNGRGLLQVWKRQIQQFNRVSPEIASAILAAFPSPQSLVKAYRKCSSEAERQRLLADVQVRRGEGVTATSRRIGPELSKRVYLLLTSCDPELSLEAAG